MTFIIFLVLQGLQAQTVDTLYILQTTDVHGNIYPYNYFKDEPADYGLAKVYTRVAEYRQKHKNVILLDGGDLLQGTPLTYFFNNIEPDVPNPLILAMNLMKYDAFAVGNHDIEQGPETYLRCQKESSFPWLSANSALPDGKTFFIPFHLIEKGGLKIAVIGLTTPGIPMWLDKSLYKNITWLDMVGAACKYAEQLRPEADVLVGLFHAGFDSSYSAAQTTARGLPNENASGMIAGGVPGFDVIFAGHSHRPEPRSKTQITDKGPLRINAGSRGYYLGIAEIVYSKQKNGCTILEKNSWLEPMKDVKPSAELMELTNTYHEKTLVYIRTPIAELQDTLSAQNSRFEDNAVIELINKAQMDYFGSDISFAASFNDRLKIEPGIIHIKDIYGIYRYENFLYFLEMSGQQIKDFLEYSAGYYIWDENKLSPNPEMAGYNYDMAEGISYDINVTKPAGKRIENLVFIKTGQPLQMDKKYTAAMNSYRASGGGGHLAAAGASDAVILKKSSKEMRSILIDYIKKSGTINPQVDNNWQVVK